MTELEQDPYVYPGPRIAQNGMVLGRGQGMTLRDWFAGNAPDAPEWWMADLSPSPPPGWSEGDGSKKWDELTNAWHIKQIALWRFAYADAMLEARK